MSKKKKIRICYPFVGDSIGGSHLSTIELIKKLDKSKFEIILILHKKGILYEYLIKEGLKPIILKIDTFVGKKKGIAVNFLSIYKNIFKLIPFIIRNNIDIVHLNDSSIGLSWIIPTRFSKAKLVWHQRVVFPNWKLYKILSFFSEKIICISDFVYESLPKYYKNKSIKILNPVTLKEKEKNNYFLKKKYFRNKKEKRILFLANIIENKRIDLFIKTAKTISNLNPNVKFFIVGSDKKKLLKKSTLGGFKNKIIYIGYSNDSVFWLKNCDLLLVTSENEGFNRTIVEGMLSKIPIIAVDSGAHNEIIKNNYNGWLIKFNNLNILTKISLEVLNLKKNLLTKILKRAEIFAKKEFNPNNHVTKISQIYLEF